jgi:predicted RNase H-like HicB family nuclease
MKHFVTIFIRLNAVVAKAEKGGFIALHPETGTTTQGEIHPEAIQNLKEACLSRTS